MPRRKFIALPNDDRLQLTPKLWMAVGLIAYNYHLFTLEPLEILATPPGAPHIPPARAEAATCGRAVMVSTDNLKPTIRSAITQISRTLLTPFGLTVSTHGGSPLPGAGRTPRYLLVEDHGSPEHSAKPELVSTPPRKAIV